jgi:hypothetical protein
MVENENCHVIVSEQIQAIKKIIKTFIGSIDFKLKPVEEFSTISVYPKNKSDVLVRRV